MFLESPDCTLYDDTKRNGFWVTGGEPGVIEVLKVWKWPIVHRSKFWPIYAQSTFALELRNAQTAHIMKTSVHLLVRSFTHTLWYGKCVKFWGVSTEQLSISPQQIIADKRGDRIMKLHILGFHSVYILSHLSKNPVIIFSSDIYITCQSSMRNTPKIAQTGPKITMLVASYQYHHSSESNHKQSERIQGADKMTFHII